MTTRHLAQLERIFKSVLECEFKNVEIVSVDIQEDVDFDGDNILLVMVVFKSDGPLDSRAAAGFVRHVRPKLQEVDEWRFPIMSFINRDDEDRIAESA